MVPSQDILKFIADDNKWGAVSLPNRIEKIKSSQQEFVGIADNHELVKKLNKDENKAMIYYLLHGGDDRFNLINSQHTPAKGGGLMSRVASKAILFHLLVDYY